MSLKNFGTILMFIAVIYCGIYTYKNRYFLRFMPIPIDSIEIINKGNVILPTQQRAVPRGEVDFGKYDLTTEQGVRAVLNAIQKISPSGQPEGFPDGGYANFAVWLSRIRTNPFYCTDATQLFILAAWQQGLPAREWHLLPSGWPSGLGHSVVEFFNPKSGEWHLIDAQHAAIVRGTKDEMLDMASILQLYKAGRIRDINFDYGEHHLEMMSGARGPAAEAYFFENDYLETPVLQLRQATWFATVPIKFVFSGEFIIGYPIIVNEWTHDNRVLTSKVSAFGMLIMSFVLLLYAAKVIRKKCISMGL